MNIWIALIRGINVGGRNRLKMDELKSDCSSLGFHDAITYIQSGNVVFRSDLTRASTIAGKLTSQILKARNIETTAIVLSLQELISASHQNPYAEVEHAEKVVHYFFLAEKSTKIDTERLASLQSNREQYELIENVLYLHAPDGIGKSKLAVGTEQCLGVAVTARNQRTVQRLLAPASAANEA